jgi:hypothetical protein
LRTFYTVITYIFFPGTMAVVGACFPYFASSGFVPLVSWSHYFGPALAVFVIIPSLGVWFLKSKGRITDFHISNRKERNLSYPLAIAPALLLAIYYYYNRASPDERFPYLWGGSVTLVLCLLWLTNALWLKASAHMAGVAGFLCIVILRFQHGSIPAVWIAITLVVCALVYIARLGLSAHSHKELLTGFCLGFITTFAVFSL